MQLIFIVHILATFFSFSIALFLQTLHLPLLRYIGPYQYPIYYEKQKMKLTLLTFPVYSLEVFTSIVLMVRFFAIGGKMTVAKQNSFFIYLSTIIILLLIHLITFYFIKPLLRKLLKQWEEKVLQELKLWNLARTFFWLARIIILLIIVINPA
jgi:hypothetical protein